MSSYLSNLLTQTTSRYNSLRRTLLSSEEDGDTEDDTHICRVLRAYYTEKGRPFPPWLPPDPNDRKTSIAQSYAPSLGSYAGGSSRSQSYSMQSQRGSRGGLSDLWDPPAAQQANAPMQPQSLRNARRPAGGGPTPAHNSNASLGPSPQARPLPSQRVGSYQSEVSQNPNRPPAESSRSSSIATVGGGTAQERLKARLWGGGRAGSPGPNQGEPPNAYDRPPQSGSNPPGNNSGGNSRESGGSSARRYGWSG